MADTDVAAYIIYKLFGTGAGGFGPNEQVAQCGMTLEGGIYGYQGYMLGYLIGDTADVLQTIAALKSWQAREITASDAVKWANTSLPVNTTQPIPVMIDTPKYIGPAEIDSTGRIYRPLSEIQWSTTDVDTWEEGRLGILNNLSNSDADTVRVLEDLVDLLISKEIIEESELPESARVKLGNRTSWRSQL